MNWKRTVLALQHGREIKKNNNNIIIVAIEFTRSARRLYSFVCDDNSLASNNCQLAWLVSKSRSENQIQRAHTHLQRERKFKSLPIHLVVCYVKLCQDSEFLCSHESFSQYYIASISAIDKLNEFCVVVPVSIQHCAHIGSQFDAVHAAQQLW